MTADGRTSSPTAEAYCATCKCAQPAKPEMIGSRFTCPKETRSTPHVAYVIADPGIKAWLWLEVALVAYQVRYSPVRLLKSFRGKGSAELYVGLRLIVLVLTVVAVHLVPSTWLTYCAVAIAGVFILDILAYHTAGLFITRWPAHPMRIVLLSFLAFVSLAMCFGIVFAVQRHAFKEPISAYQATYFSFVTIATVGYGDISPKLDGSAASNLLQLSIISEVVSGLYFLAVLVAGIVGWVGSPPPKAPNLADVLLTP